MLEDEGALERVELWDQLATAWDWRKGKLQLRCSKTMANALQKLLAYRAALDILMIFTMIGRNISLRK